MILWIKLTSRTAAHCSCVGAGRKSNNLLTIPYARGSSERFLQLAIESCLNIGNRLISLYQFDRPISAPETYADIFREIQKLGVVDHEFETSLIKMARFRNRLAHWYLEIDIEAIYGFIHENLEDFKRFEQMVVEFLNENRLGE